MIDALSVILCVVIFATAMLSKFDVYECIEWCLMGGWGLMWVVITWVFLFGLFMLGLMTGTVPFNISLM